MPKFFYRCPRDPRTRPGKYVKNKRTYETREEALRASNGHAWVYKCRICSKFHMTSIPPGPKPCRRCNGSGKVRIKVECSAGIIMGNCPLCS